MKQPFELPDEQCERLTRNEMSAVRMLLILSSEMNYAKEDLQKIMGIVPNGKARMNMLVGNCTSLFKDVLGAMSDKQRKVLKNSALDYDLKIVPKVSAGQTSIAVQKDDMTELVNCAREKCKLCALSGLEAKNCKLYRLLEAYIPLDDYGAEIICPYAYQEWE